MGKTGSHNPFQSALAVLLDDLCQKLNGGSASLLDLLDLSMAFETTNNYILWVRIGLGSSFAKIQGLIGRAGPRKQC